MDLLRIAGATLNQLPLDFAGNAARIKAVLAEARAAGVELLCLPELCVTGYGCEDQFFSLSTVKKADQALIELLPSTVGMTVAVGLPVFYYGAMYNAVALLQDGQILGVNCKRVLPREGVHYEPRWFRPWPFGKVVDAVIAGHKVPMGDIRYRLGALGIAVEICEEAWDSVPASALHADAVDIIINPSASHFALGKYSKREHLVANSSRSMQVVYLYTNLVGLEAGRMIYDGGVLVAAGGEIVARGPRFGFSDSKVTWIDINPDLASLAKLKVKPVREPAADPAGFQQTLRDPEVAGQDPRFVASRHRGAKALTKKPGQVDGAATPAFSREEEFLHAEMLGLFDYLRKSHSQGFVLSLSGGCDSATCAVLIGHMVAAAIHELGLAGFSQRLRLKPVPAGSADARVVIQQLLTCVYQKTAHSGAVTEHAARAVATAIGAAFHVVDVEPMVASYRDAAGKILGRALDWQQDDTALQNIQARSRAPLVWLIANVKNALLITTSNRSEGSVGYATMDGDTAGGLAPISGIDKRFLRQWLVWAEKSCTLGLGALPALKAVNVQQPTAELRPPSSSQTDEDDLMPYDVLERIERYLVRDRLGPEDILQTLAYDFPALPPKDLTGFLNKFLRLWAQSQWKRERLAPSFHLDDASIDPKTWCRFPIFSEPYRVLIFKPVNP